MSSGLPYGKNYVMFDWIHVEFILTPYESFFRMIHLFVQTMLPFHTKYVVTMELCPSHLQLMPWMKMHVIYESQYNELVVVSDKFMFHMKFFT